MAIRWYLFRMSTRNQVIFERNYGVRQISTHANELITSVSQPDWPSFVRSIGGLARQGTGNLITSPELITSADISLAAISRNREVIEGRVTEAKGLTKLLPEATLLLGTVAFDQTVQKPQNAVLFLRDGAEIGRTYKKNPIGMDEREFLHVPHAADIAVTQPTPNVLTIICSDLVSPPAFDNQVDTLLVSACWGTPAGYPGVVASSDRRHLTFIQDLTTDLFEQHPSLGTIVMTDRAPEENSMAGPFNFVALR